MKLSEEEEEDKGLGEGDDLTHELDRVHRQMFPLEPLPDRESFALILMWLFFGSYALVPVHSLQLNLWPGLSEERLIGNDVLIDVDQWLYCKRILHCVFEMKNDDDDEPLEPLHDHPMRLSIRMVKKCVGLMMKDGDVGYFVVMNDNFVNNVAEVDVAGDVLNDDFDGLDDDIVGDSGIDGVDGDSMR